MLLDIGYVLRLEPKDNHKDLIKTITKHKAQYQYIPQVRLVVITPDDMKPELLMELRRLNSWGTKNGIDRTSA